MLIPAQIFIFISNNKIKNRPNNQSVNKIGYIFSKKINNYTA